MHACMHTYFDCQPSEMPFVSVVPKDTFISSNHDMSGFLVDYYFLYLRTPDNGVSWFSCIIEPSELFGDLLRHTHRRERETREKERKRERERERQREDGLTQTCATIILKLS